jgi:hypothetical protein
MGCNPSSTCSPTDQPQISHRRPLASVAQARAPDGLPSVPYLRSGSTLQATIITCEDSQRQNVGSFGKYFREGNGRGLGAAMPCFSRFTKPTKTAWRAELSRVWRAWRGRRTVNGYVMGPGWARCCALRGQRGRREGGCVRSLWIGGSNGNHGVDGMPKRGCVKDAVCGEEVLRLTRTGYYVKASQESLENSNAWKALEASSGHSVREARPLRSVDRPLYRACTQ